MFFGIPVSKRLVNKLCSGRFLCFAGNPPSLRFRRSKHLLVLLVGKPVAGSDCSCAGYVDLRRDRCLDVHASTEKAKWKPYSKRTFMLKISTSDVPTVISRDLANATECVRFLIFTFYIARLRPRPYLQFVSNNRAPRYDCRCRQCHDTVNECE